MANTIRLWRLRKISQISYSLVIWPTTCFLHSFRHETIVAPYEEVLLFEYKLHTTIKRIWMKESGLPTWCNLSATSRKERLSNSPSKNNGMEAPPDNQHSDNERVRQSLCKITCKKVFAYNIRISLVPLRRWYQARHVTSICSGIHSFLFSILGMWTHGANKETNGIMLK